jgi:acetyltransferase
MKRLITIARDERLDRLQADVLPENAGMHRILTRLNFEMTAKPGEPVIRAVLELDHPSSLPHNKNKESLP